MALSIGHCKGRIVSNAVKEINGKVTVVLTIQTEHGDVTNVLIFLTDKSAGIARRQLKLCGFNVDTQELEEMEDNGRLLEGVAVPLVVEEYGGKIRAQIDTNTKPEKWAMQSAMAGLRAAKKRGFDEPGPETEEAPPVGDEHAPAPPAGDDIPF